MCCTQAYNTYVQHTHNKYTCTHILQKHEKEVVYHNMYKQAQYMCIKHHMHNIHNTHVYYTHAHNTCIHMCASPICHEIHPHLHHTRSTPMHFIPHA